MTDRAWRPRVRWLSVAIATAVVIGTITLVAGAVLASPRTVRSIAHGSQIRLTSFMGAGVTPLSGGPTDQVATPGPSRSTPTRGARASTNSAAAGEAQTGRTAAVVTSGPAISLVKSAEPSNFDEAGTKIAYHYEVSNTGDVTLASVGVTDPMPGLSTVTCPVPTLAPTASETCTATYTTTQADVARRSITNTATATGTPQISASSNTVQVPFQPPVVAQPRLAAGETDPVGGATAVSPARPAAPSAPTAVLAESPGMSVVKSADAASYFRPNSPIHYSYVVTNTGDVNLTSVSVSDPMPGLSAVACPGAALAPAATQTCTATYTTTQADVNNERTLINSATTTGNAPAINATASLTVPAYIESLNIVKSASVSTYAAAGTAITYQYKLTNTGTVSLASLRVTDPMPGLSAVTCPDSTLAPSASETCTATYSTTQTDVDRGSITNTATVTATPPDISAVSNTVQIPIVVLESAHTDSSRMPGAFHANKIYLASARLQAAADPQDTGISVTKSADASSYASANTTIHYRYDLTNTGVVVLTSVHVTDPMPGLSAISCPDSTLAPGATESCTATYTTTQTDVNNGTTLTNTASATGTPPAVSSTASLTIPASQNPALGLVKSASVSSFSAPATAVTYDYQVTNTGNVTLASVNVSDPMPRLSPVHCPGATLAPAGTETCTATYTTTQADLDAGSITNTATATGTPPNVTSTSVLTIPLVTGSAADSSGSASPAPIGATSSAGIGITKSAVPSTYSASGELVTYRYQVTNAGDVTLTSVGVTDPMPGLSPVSCPNPTLAPSAAETCAATYTTTQADVQNGSITNTATVTATPPKVSATASLTIPAVQKPSLRLVKTASISGFSSPGTAVTYDYQVTNTGNVTLTSVNVTDPMPRLSPVHCPITTLAPAATETCTATYTTTQSDVDHGSIKNTGTGTARTPAGTDVSAISRATVRATQGPAISVIKSASITRYARPGTFIIYTYKVTNTGNVSLTPVGVSDPMPRLSPLHCPVTTLAPAATETCTATYTTTQADVDNGSITNTGTATGTPPSGGSAVTARSSVTILADRTPSLALSKSANISRFAAAGTSVTYAYRVTNTGDVTLTAVTVTDPMPGLSAVSCPVPALSPGGAETCHARYTTSQGDVIAGAITNVGTATGVAPNGVVVTTRSSLSIPATATTRRPAIQLNPTVATPGSIVTVTGTGFPDSAPVTIRWSVSTGSVSVTTDQFGNLPPNTELLVLTPDVLGPRTADALGYPASAPFLVVPNSSQPGGSDASLIYRAEGP